MPEYVTSAEIMNRKKVSSPRKSTENSSTPTATAAPLLPARQYSVNASTTSTANTPPDIYADDGHDTPGGSSDAAGQGAQGQAPTLPSRKYSSPQAGVHAADEDQTFPGGDAAELPEDAGYTTVISPEDNGGYATVAPFTPEEEAALALATSASASRRAPPLQPAPADHSPGHSRASFDSDGFSISGSSNPSRAGSSQSLAPSRDGSGPSITHYKSKCRNIWIRQPRCVLISDPSTLGAGGKNTS